MPTSFPARTPPSQLLITKWLNRVLMLLAALITGFAYGSLFGPAIVAVFCALVGTFVTMWSFATACFLGCLPQALALLRARLTGAAIT